MTSPAPGAAAPEPMPKPETPAEEIERAKHPVPPSPNGGIVGVGEELFAAHCVSCHGPKGEGTGDVPSLQGEPQAQTSTGVIEELILPTPGDMPNFDKSLTFIQKEAVAYFVTVRIARTEEEVP